MSYTRTKAAVFGAAYTGLATVAYSLDGTTWTTTGISEIGAGSGSYQADVTFPDGFRGVLRWRTAVGGKIAPEEINPETAEIATAVWANGTRTLTAFGFTVSASITSFSWTPVIRNQDNITAPNADDCLISMWAAANGKEIEDDAAKTWVRYGPDGETPIRSFVLTTDANGTPVGRE